MNDRKLNTMQKSNNLNTIFAVNDRAYRVDRTELDPNDDNYPDYNPIAFIDFQEGDVNDETSRVGVTELDLLEIVRDRLINFENSECSTRHNARALMYIEMAIDCLITANKNNKRSMNEIWYDTRI